MFRTSLVSLLRQLPSLECIASNIDNVQYFLISPLHTFLIQHYSDIVMGAIESQITSFKIVFSAVYSAADHRKHQSSVSLAFVRAILRWSVNSPHKWPVTRKMFPFDDIIMIRATSNVRYIGVCLELIGISLYSLKISRFGVRSIRH